MRLLQCLSQPRNHGGCISDISRLEHHAGQAPVPLTFRYSGGVCRWNRTSGTDQTRRLGAKVCMPVLSALFVSYLFGEIGIQVIFRFMPGVKEYLKTIAI